MMKILNFMIPTICWVFTYIIAYFFIFKRLSEKGKISKGIAILPSIITTLFVSSFLTLGIVSLIL